MLFGFHCCSLPFFALLFCEFLWFSVFFFVLLVCTCRCLSLLIFHVCCVWLICFYVIWFVFAFICLCLLLFGCLCVDVSVHYFVHSSTCIVSAMKVMIWTMYLFILQCIEFCLKRIHIAYQLHACTCAHTHIRCSHAEMHTYTRTQIYDQVNEQTS